MFIYVYDYFVYVLWLFKSQEGNQSAKIFKILSDN